MHFKLKKNPINFHYSILSSKIELVSHSKNLGIIFDSKYNFSLLTEMIKNKAMRILGFVKRTHGSFKDPGPLKFLYCSLVHYSLEYLHLFFIIFLLLFDFI